jgi:hypothetical protein
MSNVPEALAALEHEQWIAWSKSLAAAEPLSAERVERWQRLWVPYADLSEQEKDADRVWAEKVLALTTDPLASALTLEYRECCRRLADPALQNPLWWLGYRCGIEDLVARLAEKGIAVTLPSPATRRDR